MAHFSMSSENPSEIPCQNDDTYSVLDKALIEWYVQTRRKCVSVTKDMLLKKYVEYAGRFGHAQIKDPDSFLEKWMNLHSIGLNTDQQFDQLNLSKNATLLNSVKDYDLRDIYTLKEMAIYYTLDTDDVFKESCSSEKQKKSDKKYYSLILVSNGTGRDKRPIVVMGDDNLNKMHLMPVDYVQSLNAWVTADIFVNWLIAFDKRMRKQKRNVVLILDESPVHPYEADSDLTNVKLVFIHKSDKARNPFDLGVTGLLRALYRKCLVQRKFIGRSYNFISRLEACHMLNRVWTMLNPEMIRSCFLKANLNIEGRSNFIVEVLSIPLLSVEEAKTYTNYDKDLPYYKELTDAEICEKVKTCWVDISERNTSSGTTSSSICSNPRKSSTEIPVTVVEMSEMLLTLRRFYETNEGMDFNTFYELENQILHHMRKQKTE